jgi:hypothetical protein
MTCNLIFNLVEPEYFYVCDSCGVSNVVYQCAAVLGVACEAYRGTTGVDFSLVEFWARVLFMDNKLIQLVRIQLGWFLH